MRTFFLSYFAALTLFAAGCGDDETSPSGGGGASSGGEGGTGGTGGETGGAPSQGGAGGAGGGPIRCDEPASAVIGPDGGELSHCGATLTIPAGAVSAEETFTIAIEATPPEAPFEREFASPIFVITPEEPALNALLSLTLEHEAGDSRFELAWYDETEQTFFPINPCEVTDTSKQQFVGLLGTYTVLRDINDYPDTTSGLGDGTMNLDFLGAPSVFDLDSPGSYGIFENRADGGRNVTLIAQRDVEGGIERLRADVLLDEGGASGTLIQVEWLSTVLGGGYSYIDGLVGSDGTLDITETAEGRLVGSFSANVNGGNPPAEEPLAATFDVSAELFKFPPELECPGPR
ncbi:MAG: hypothetical protein HOW73_46535 [Polyangiaceae bacterium]|nr:hypothetical protein [Polyangiaceae bacterium]